MLSALAQSIPQETRAWALNLLLLLTLALVGLLTLAWVISRHRIQRYQRGKGPQPTGELPDAWRESARRLDTNKPDINLDE